MFLQKSAVHLLHKYVGAHAKYLLLNSINNKNKQQAICSININVAFSHTLNQTHAYIGNMINNKLHDTLYSVHIIQFFTVHVYTIQYTMYTVCLLLHCTRTLLNKITHTNFV